MLHWTSAAQCWGCCFIRRFPLTLDLRHLNGQSLLFGMCESAGVVWRVSPDNDLFKGCVCMFVYVLSGVRFFAAPQTVAHHAPMSMGFSRQEYWNGLPYPPQGDLPDPGMEHTSPLSPALPGRFFTTVLPGNLKKNSWF